jgi:hypothetical protein
MPTITLSSLLGALCRLSGCAATLLLMYLMAHHLPESSAAAALQIALALLLAVLLGNVIKEGAFALCETVTTALGRSFVRRTATLRGHLVTEVWLPGGTWFRSETWRGGAACTWTESDGSCTRVESPAMTVKRTTPQRSWTDAYVHGRPYAGGAPSASAHPGAA